MPGSFRVSKGLTYAARQNLGVGLPGPEPEPARLLDGVTGGFKRRRGVAGPQANVGQLKPRHQFKRLIANVAERVHRLPQTTLRRLPVAPPLLDDADGHQALPGLGDVVQRLENGSRFEGGAVRVVELAHGEVDLGQVGVACRDVPRELVFLKLALRPVQNRHRPDVVALYEVEPPDVRLVHSGRDVRTKALEGPCRSLEVRSGRVVVAEVGGDVPQVGVGQRHHLPVSSAPKYRSSA